MEVSRSNLSEQISENKCRRPGRYSKQEDDRLLPMIRAIVAVRDTYGYRRTTALLNVELENQGKPAVNHKRIYRIMKAHGLLLPKHTGKRTRVHDGKIITLRSNTRWCSDAFTIQCWNAERVHVAFSLDTCDREVIRYLSSTIGVDGQMIRDLMVETVEARFGSVSGMLHTVQWLSDNGPGYVAHDTVDMARKLQLDPCTTPSYSPESNGMAEAFVKTFKRDYVWTANLQDARSVMEQLPAWFEDYNERAPHKGLKMLSPRQFRRKMEQQLAS
jgi:transposase InsO family protein